MEEVVVVAEKKTEKEGDKQREIKIERSTKQNNVDCGVGNHGFLNV